MCFYQEKHALQPPPESSLLCRCFFNVEIKGLWSNWVIYTKLVFSVRARTESHVVVNKRSMELEEQVDALIYDFLCSTCWWNICLPFISSFWHLPIFIFSASLPHWKWSFSLTYGHYQRMWWKYWYFIAQTWLRWRRFQEKYCYHSIILSLIFNSNVLCL